MIWAATRRQAERAEYFDPETVKIYSFVVEPSLGADRVALAYLCEAYDEEVVDVEKNDSRVVMRFHPALAPLRLACCPFQKARRQGKGNLCRTFKILYGGL